jgi:hypothetical protein
MLTNFVLVLYIAAVWAFTFIFLKMEEADVEFAAHNNRGFSGRIMEFEFAGPGDVLHIQKIGAISAARRSFLSNGLPMQKQMTQSLSMGNMVTTI